MYVATGFYNSRKNPCLEVYLAGALSRPKFSPGARLEAVIDTGFEGFLSMPLVQALPLGLVLSDQIEVVLADGSTRAELVALGYATIGEKRRRVQVILQRNSDEVLVGAEFLRLWLFHRDALREIARLIYVRAPQDRHVIREQL